MTQEKIRAYGKKLGLNSEDSEDFTQHVLEQQFKNRKADIGKIFIDFLRLRSGDARSKYYETRIKLNNPEPFNEQQHTIKPEKRPDLSEYLTGQNKSIFLLYTKWGFELKEIGEIFDMCESSVCKRLKRITFYLRRRISLINSKSLTS